MPHHSNEATSADLIDNIKAANTAGLNYIGGQMLGIFRKAEIELNMAAEVVAQPNGDLSIGRYTRVESDEPYRQRLVDAVRDLERSRRERQAAEASGGSGGHVHLIPEHADNCVYTGQGKWVCSAKCEIGPAATDPGIPMHFDACVFTHGLAGGWSCAEQCPVEAVVQVALMAAERDMETGVPPTSVEVTIRGGDTSHFGTPVLHGKRNAEMCLHNAVRRSMSRLMAEHDKIPTTPDGYRMIRAAIARALGVSQETVVVTPRPPGFQVEWNGVGQVWPPADDQAVRVLSRRIDETDAEFRCRVRDGMEVRDLAPDETIQAALRNADADFDRRLRASRAVKNAFRNEESVHDVERVSDIPRSGGWTIGGIVRLDGETDSEYHARIAAGIANAKARVEGARKQLEHGRRLSDVSPGYNMEQSPLRTTSVALVDKEPDPACRIRLERPDGFSQDRIDQIKTAMLAVTPKVKR